MGGASRVFEFYVAVGSAGLRGWALRFWCGELSRTRGSGAGGGAEVVAAGFALAMG